MISFGVEEEFMLLDRESLQPAPHAPEIVAELSRDATIGPFVSREFLASQVEHSSPVFTSLDAARHAITEFRTRIGEAASARGLVAGSVGLPFEAPRHPTLSAGERYQHVEDDIRALTGDHQVNGLHVHVGVPSRELGVAVLNRIRPWIPTLLGLSGNSPFWRGADTGFSSWRSIHLRRWMTTGCPPLFASETDYRRRADDLVGIGGTADVQMIAWNARLSERHPTVEFRVFDAQLTADDTVLIAALCRALVATALEQAHDVTSVPEPTPELLDAALWHAARDGVTGKLVDPLSGTLRESGAVIAALVEYVRPGLEANGDSVEVDRLLAARSASGSGADRQRESFQREGLPGIRSLLLSTLIENDV